MSLIRESDDPWLVLGVCLVCLGAFVVMMQTQVSIAVDGGSTRIAPTAIRLRVVMQPDPANRRLIVRLVDQDGFVLQRSDEQMDGAQSPRTRWVPSRGGWRIDAAGMYMAEAIVERETGRPWRASTTVTVRGRGEPFARRR